MTGSAIVLTIGVLAIAVLSAGSIAVRSVSRIWLRHWAEQRLRGSSAAVTYLERPHRLLIASSTGVSLIVMLLGLWLSLHQPGSGWALFWDYLGLALLILVCGQILPRVIARRWAAAAVPITLPALRAAEMAAAPLLEAGRVIARPLDGTAEPPARAAEERDPLHDLLREGELEGVGEHDEIAIISGVVAFGSKVVRDVMMPRAEIFALPDTLDPHALALAIARSGYSRVPIYHERLDDIVGMVHAFDVLKARGEEMPPLRPVASATADRRCNDLLFAMLAQRIHLAVVRDERGQLLGLVTLEDLLEELVGDIRDEHDEPAPGAPGAPAVLPPKAPPADASA